MVALDDIRICRWRTLRLRAATLTTKVLWRITRSSRTLTALPALLRRILVCNTGLLSGKLSAGRLVLRYGAVVHGALLARRPCVANDIVCSALATTFMVGNWAVAIVGVGVLEDDVPGVEQAGEKPETAEGDVDERVARA